MPASVKTVAPIKSADKDSLATNARAWLRENPAAEVDGVKASDLKVYGSTARGRVGTSVLVAYLVANQSVARQYAQTHGIVVNGKTKISKKVAADIVSARPRKA